MTHVKVGDVDATRYGLSEDSPDNVVALQLAIDQTVALGYYDRIEKLERQMKRLEYYLLGILVVVTAIFGALIWK